MSTSGPFRTIVVDIKDCEHPSHPYMSDPPMNITMKVFNTSSNTLISGSIKVLKDTKDAKSKLQGYIWKNSKWSMMMTLNNTACHGVVMPYIYTVTGIKYDRMKRMYLKGQYAFRNIDINAIQHMFVSKVKYGKALWVFEAYQQRAGAFYCNEFYTVKEAL